MPSAPLPPTLNLAVPVTNLAATRTGDQVHLSWTVPTKNTDKLLLKDHVRVRVCRREVASQSCIVAGNLDLAPGAEGVFSEELPQQLATGVPRSLTYFVELRNRNERSAGPSNAAMVLAGEAPAAVKGLGAELRKEGVVLHWNGEAQGPEAAAIRLRRKLLTPVAAKPTQGPLAPPPEQIDENLLVDTSGQFTDRALDKDIRFGATYEYRAQRVTRAPVNSEMMELDGPLSEPVRVEATDVFPPGVPTGLAAVAVAGENGAVPAIDLNWQPNTEPDLAGYIVYRREGASDWQRVSPLQLVDRPGFHDVQVQAGQSYQYAVTAVDQDGHESGKSAEATEAVPNP
jgi:hypothetical protein